MALLAWPQQLTHPHTAGGDHDHPAAAKTLYSYVSDPDEERYNADWVPKPRLRAGVHADRIYFLIHWAVERSDSLYRHWKRSGKRWRRSNSKDDMLALRFEIGGDFDSCMVSGKEYQVDLWRWSAGRSDKLGIADDMHHAYSPNFIDNAIAYSTVERTVYIVKRYDSGSKGWRHHTRPKEKKAKVVEGIILDEKVRGSVTDVEAKGHWLDGIWTLELSRQLRTDDSTDVVFRKGEEIVGQLAFFNAGYRLRKQISETLVFDLSKLK